MFYLINKENPAAESLMLKMAEQAKPGALIPCSTEEINSFTNGDFIPVALTPDDSKLIQVDPMKTYILFANKEMEIDDIMTCITRLKINIGVVRTGKE